MNKRGEIKKTVLTKRAVNAMRASGNTKKWTEALEFNLMEEEGSCSMQKRYSSNTLPSLLSEIGAANFHRSFYSKTRNAARIQSNAKEVQGTLSQTSDREGKGEEKKYMFP